MSKPNDSASRRDQLHRRVLAAFSVVGLIAGTGLVFGATSGIASRTVDRIAPNDPVPGTSMVQKPSGSYQLRCWQYGRLLFDEGPVALGPEVRQGAKLVVIDRNGAPLIVTSAGGTTCLARPQAASPNPALPR